MAEEKSQQTHHHSHHSHRSHSKRKREWNWKKMSPRQKRQFVKDIAFWVLCAIAAVVILYAVIIYQIDN